MKKLFLNAAKNIAAIFCFAQRSKFNFNHEWKVFVSHEVAAKSRGRLSIIEVEIYEAITQNN